MNKLIAIYLVLLCHCAFAQPIHVVKKDNAQFETRMSGYSKNAIFTDAGTIAFADLLKISFTEYHESDDQLYRNLKGIGVEVTYDYKAGTSASVISANNQVIPRPEPTIGDLTRSLDQYRQQRETAKGMQLVGVLAIGGSWLVQSIFNKNYQDAVQSGKNAELKSVSPIIPAIGLGLFTAGIAIDLGAGKHLKVKAK